MGVGRAVRAGFVAAAAAMALGVSACGGEEENGGQSAEAGDQPAQTADASRYCELAKQLESNAEQHFSQLGEGGGPTEFREAHVTFIEQNQDVLQEILEAAPEQIRDDVETTLAGMRQQAGEQVDVTEQKIDAADRRLRAFESERCENR